MDWNLKKMWPAATASLVAFTALAHANGQQDQMYQKNNGNQQQYSPNQELTRNAEGPDMLITPNAGPTNRLFFTGEALFWNTAMDGLEFAIEDGSFDDTNSIVNSGKMLSPKTKWNVGFRLGLGYVFHRDGWDLLLSWTNFHGKTKQSSDDCEDCCPEPTGTPILTMFSDIANNDDDLLASSTFARLKAELNIVDLDLGRGFQTSKWLALRPFIGVRGSWISQKYKVQYTGLSNTAGLGPFDLDDATSTAHMKNNWWGVGPRVGLNSRWGLGMGFSIYGNAAVSLVFGQFKVSQHENAGLSTDDDDEGANMVDFSDRYSAGRAITDLALGFMWEHDFKGGWGLAFNVGWEQHLFFNQNRFWRVVRPAGTDSQVFSHESGDLSYQGVTLGGRIAF